MLYLHYPYYEYHMWFSFSFKQKMPRYPLDIIYVTEPRRYKPRPGAGEITKEKKKKKKENNLGNTN